MSLLIIILENVINKEFKINIRKDILMLGKSRVKRILKMYRVNIKNKFLKKNNIASWLRLYLDNPLYCLVIKKIKILVKTALFVNQK